jgi:hypothetical protein
MTIVIEFKPEYKRPWWVAISGQSPRLFSTFKAALKYVEKHAWDGVTI